MFDRQRLSFPCVNEKDIVFNGARKWKVRRVNLAGSRIAIVSGAQNPRSILFGDCELRESFEFDARPAIVEAAPSRDAMKIARVLDLRKGHEFLPGERHWVFYEARDLQSPIRERKGFAAVRPSGNSQPSEQC